MQLKDWLDNNLMSGSELSKALDINRSYTYAIIRGKYRPGKYLIQKLRDFTKNAVTEEDFSGETMNTRKKVPIKCPYCEREICGSV